MPTDADLRLVAEAVGFQCLKPSGLVDREEPFDWFVYPNGRHSNAEPLPDLRNDDAEAARWLLPWLEKMSRHGGVFRVNYLGPKMYFAELDRRDPRGKVVFHHVPPRSSFAAALFDLCLRLAKGNEP